MQVGQLVAVERRKVLDKRYSGYIDRVKQLDGEDAFQTFMTAYAESTDPHTDYLGPREAQNFDIAMKLSLEGIGAVLQARDDYTQILELVPAGPAAKSGKIHVGDRIVGVFSCPPSEYDAGEAPSGSPKMEACAPA